LVKPSISPFFIIPPLEKGARGDLTFLTYLIPLNSSNPPHLDPLPAWERKPTRYPRPYGDLPTAGREGRMRDSLNPSKF